MRAHVSVPKDLSLHGAKLATMTQRQLYVQIKALRGRVERPATVARVALVSEAIRDVTGQWPTEAQVWRSIRHKDLSKGVKSFLYNAMHDAQRIGKYWKHIPECGDREMCVTCGVREDLEHVLLKCERVGQNQIWTHAKELWLQKHPDWPELSLGTVLGCGFMTVKDERGRTLTGASRLLRILMSESTYLIWKLRNECVIRNDGVAPSEREVSQ
ncbi:hypothetical protein FB45DRAFT_835186 [Roridomyces roridus]|uniref:Reverse transcriptase zinc-binding domain-containing protein n=1 Tax=Roridomyces roridus TaxID=1738132 RepID=A0AAD7BPE3_9AGAR|nr:hypothetical protein FB45DRAFT_835186 [Roridomyces roridus]